MAVGRGQQWSPDALMRDSHINMNYNPSSMRACGGIDYKAAGPLSRQSHTRLGVCNAGSLVMHRISSLLLSASERTPDKGLVDRTVATCAWTAGFAGFAAGPIRPW